MRLCGISSRFQLLSPCVRQVTHALLTRPPLSQSKCFARLACVKHAASVHPEPGSNSLKKLYFVKLRVPTSWNLGILHFVSLFDSGHKIAWLLVSVTVKYFSTLLLYLVFVLWIILFEFSGLHYCLFVKVQCVLRLFLIKHATLIYYHKRYASSRPFFIFCDLFLAFRKDETVPIR